MKGRRAAVYFEFRWDLVFFTTVKVLSTKCAASKSCLMFMFRSKRTSLAKRLWKARIRREHETGCQTKTDADLNEENKDPKNSCDENVLRTYLLKRLKENELEMLVTAVESGGDEVSTCVLLPRDLVDEPHLRCCQTWRWPDLRQPCELKQLPLCDSAKDPYYVCCNPYHYSRLCKPGEYVLYNFFT